MLKLMLLLLPFVTPRCMYNIDSHLMPYPVDSEPFLLSGLTACQEYNGRMGCCSSFNNQATQQNFKQIDGIFGSEAAGCDICAVNLKRFWCEYACSDRQDSFMKTGSKLEPFEDPQKPGETILGLRISVTVESLTACDLFNSCKRNPFVASVSAMGSPAGFMNFQGHNALDGGHQYIEMIFSNRFNDSIWFSKDSKDVVFEHLDRCDFVPPNSTIHTFDFLEKCECNTCEEACDSSKGFKYTESEVLEGFDYTFVGGVYGVFILLAVGLTAYRARASNSKIDTHIKQ